MQRFSLTAAKGLLLSAVVFNTSFAAGHARADDIADAAKKAGEILRLINDKQYDPVWDGYVSSVFKKDITKNQFVANLTLGRNALAPISGSKLVSTEFFTSDPSTGYQGKGYAITFLNTYGTNNFYERLIVIEDSDGQMRLSGIWGAPAPQGQTK